MAERKTHNWRLARHGTVTAVAGVSVLLANVAQAKAMTGVFSGQGRGCWGKLYLREKTIEWNTPYSVCRQTGYRILQKVFSGEPFKTGNHIVFKLNHINNSCHYPFIGLYYQKRKNKYYTSWNAIGFQNYNDYKNFDFLSVVNGKPWSPSILLCGMPGAIVSY